jgi:hypothetical protein
LLSPHDLSPDIGWISNYNIKQRERLQSEQRRRRKVLAYVPEKVGMTKRKINIRIEIPKSSLSPLDSLGVYIEPVYLQSSLASEFLSYMEEKFAITHGGIENS